jgi:hypothetical protein
MRSQMAFLGGVLGEVVMMCCPAALSTSPDAAVKAGSRWWIRDRRGPGRSPESMAGLRACCTARAAVGCAVTAARSPGAGLDECRHVRPLERHRLRRQEAAGDDRVRLGGRELPPGRPVRRIDTSGVEDLPDAAIACPGRASSPWIRLWHRAGFSGASRTISVLTETPVDGRPGRRRPVAVRLRAAR